MFSNPIRSIMRVGLPAVSLVLAAFAAPAVRADTAIAEDYLAKALARHRFVLLGEKHDNPGHHLIQARLLSKMIAAGRRPAVVWEMIGRGKQPAIDAFMAGANADPDRFADAVGWAESGWPDWKIYRPIAEVALAAGLPMIAGNIDRGIVRRLARGAPGAGGNLRRLLRLDEPLPDSVRSAVAEEVYRGHCGFVPRAHLSPMVRVQIARDASLAEAMVTAASGADGALLIAGGQHVRRDIGVAYHLIWRHGVRDLVSLALLERGGDRPAEPDSALSRRFDYVWFTEQAHPDRDYCADLEARFGKRK